MGTKGWLLFFVSEALTKRQKVHVDVLWQAYFMATLQLMGPLGLGVGPNPTNPYLSVTNQRGFATFGGPHFATLVVEVATRALHTVWYPQGYLYFCLRSALTKI